MSKAHQVFELDQIVSQSSLGDSLELGQYFNHTDSNQKQEGSLPVERERRYICDYDLIAELITTSDNRLERSEIVQSYFPKEFGYILLPLIAEFHDLPLDSDSIRVTQARVREERKLGSEEPTYTLTIKGRSPELRPTERVELEVPILSTTYQSLLRSASLGSVEKERVSFPLSGWSELELNHQDYQSIYIEVDLPKERYRGQRERESLSHLKLAFLEIEMASRAVEDELKAGFQQLAAGERLLDISPDCKSANEVRKLCSWSRIARKGLSVGKLKRELKEISTGLPALLNA